MAFVFNAEDQVFTNKTDWTEEEMIEIVTSKYGSLDPKLAALEQLKIDVENGVLKKKQFYGFNGASVKKYIKDHPEFLYESRGRYSDEKAMRIWIDGKHHTLDDTYDVNKTIDYIKGLTLESRFSTAASEYRKEEEKWMKDHKDDIYYKEHDDTVRLGRLADAYLDNFRIEAVTGVDIELGFSKGYRTNVVGKTDVNPSWSSGFRTNTYGELTYNNEILSKEKVQDILNLSAEFSLKASAIGREYMRLLKEIAEREEV